MRHDENRMLKAILTEDDVLLAIKKLQRYKAGSEDGIYNDFYKACAPIVVPQLTLTCNKFKLDPHLRSRFLEPSLCH